MRLVLGVLYWSSYAFAIPQPEFQEAIIFIDRECGV